MTWLRGSTGRDVAGLQVGDASGGKELWKHLSAKLGVERNGTTEDGQFTLRSAECLASCGTAPAMLLDGERHENLTPDQVDRLLETAK